MTNCIFCKISNKEIPSSLVYEDDSVLAFNDMAPLAKVHILFIHKKHTHNVAELLEKNFSQIEDVFAGIKNYLAQNQYGSEGFRLVVNNGESAGQSVFHTHIHFLAGERLGKFGR